MGSSASIPHSKHCAFYDFDQFTDSKRAGDGQLRCTCSRRTRALRRTFLKARARRTDAAPEHASSPQNAPFSPIISGPNDLSSIPTRQSSSSDRSRAPRTQHQLQLPSGGFGSSSRSSSPSRSSTSGSTGAPSTPGSPSWYSSGSTSAATSSPDTTPQPQQAGEPVRHVRPGGSPTLAQQQSQLKGKRCCEAHSEARCSSDSVAPDVLIGGARWLAARISAGSRSMLNQHLAGFTQQSSFNTQAGARALLKREFASVKALNLLQDKVEIQIAAFLNLFAANVKLDDHLFVLAFVLLERLSALPGDRAVELTRDNWRAVLVTTLTVALKVQLDDIRVTNKDVCQLFPLFHPRQLNDMENEFLQRVNWSTFVPTSTWESAYSVFHANGEDIRRKLGSSSSRSSKSRSSSIDSCGASEFKECA